MERRMDAMSIRAHVFVEFILAACTIRLYQCSNVWTTRTFECPNRCGTVCTEPPLTLSVGSTPNNFRRTSPVGCASRLAERQRGIQRALARASSMSCHGWRHQHAMMDILRAMSDAAYDKISYENVLEQHAEALTNGEEWEHAAR